MQVIIGITRGLLGGIAIAGALSTGTMASDAPDGHWRPPPVGTLLEYNQGTSCRVMAVDELRFYCKGDRSYWVQDVTWSVYRGILPDVALGDGAPISFDEREAGKLFPLEVGNAVTLGGRTGSIAWEMKLKVTSFKRVETRIGERPVFSISYIESADNGYKAKGWGYLDAEYGFYHSGKRVEVSGGNKEFNWRLFMLELPTK